MNLCEWCFNEFYPENSDAVMRELYCSRKHEERDVEYKNAEYKDLESQSPENPR